MEKTDTCPTCSGTSIKHEKVPTTGGIDHDFCTCNDCGARWENT